MTEYSVGDCNEERDGTSLVFTCDASPTPEPTTPMPTNDGSDTTMDDTIVDDTQTTDDVDPTGANPSPAFAVSKVIAVILSVVGSVYFV